MAWDQAKYKRRRYQEDPEYRARIRANAKRNYRRRHHVLKQPLPKQKRPPREVARQRFRERYSEKFNAKFRERYNNDAEFKAKVKQSKKRAKARIAADPVRKAKESAKARAYRLANPDRIRDNMLKREYGITLADFNRMFESQNRRCAICETPRPGRQWMTDHCHSTGLVRGVLCNHCNWMLGHAKDSPAILKAAIAYLEKHSVVSVPGE